MTAHITQAFAAALTAQLPALRRYARALCGNNALADDLVQDAVERALTRAGSLQEVARMGAWMRSIVHNLYLDELRRRRVRGTNVDMEDMANDIAFSTPASQGGPLNDVARALHRLSLEHREVLILSAVEALSYREIAAELAVPVGTVMSRLARARVALRDMLEPVPQPMGQRA